MYGTRVRVTHNTAPVAPSVKDLGSSSLEMAGCCVKHARRVPNGLA
jgi:hypothetical protein